MKTVYTCFCTDIIHEGHRNIIRRAKAYGRVVVGVLSDGAMVRYRRFPTVGFEARLEMVRAMEGVDEVVIQDEVMYDGIVGRLRPDYIAHGDNWREPPLNVIRENVIGALKRHGGELLEFPYTYSETVKRLDDRIKERLAMPEYRRGRLKQLLKLCPIVKAIEVHDGLTGLIAEKTVVGCEHGLDQFDAMWVSSLCDSTAKGKPDIELVDMTSRFRTINDVMEVTTKPIIFDGDTGG